MDQSGRILQKRGGGVATSMNVMLITMGRLGQHIPWCAKWWGVFEAKVLRQQGQNQEYFVKQGEGLTETGFP